MYESMIEFSLSILLVSLKQVSPESFVGMPMHLKKWTPGSMRYAYDRFEPVSERFLLEGEKKKAVGALSFTQLLHCPNRSGRRGNLISGSRSSI